MERYINMPNIVSFAILLAAVALVTIGQAPVLPALPVVEVAGGLG